MSDSCPTIVVIAAHPVWNVPPFFNASREFARAGYRVIFLGYHKENLPRIERIGKGARILRLKLRARSLPFQILRKFLGLMEFHHRCKKTVQRIAPEAIVIFNDPSTLLVHPLKKKLRVPVISWLLEYPETDLAGFAEAQLLRFCKRNWDRSDMLVVPNFQRLALHMSQRPTCLNQKTFVVHNAPVSISRKSVGLSDGAKEAIEMIRDAHERGDLVVVYSGAVGIRYGIQTLLRAVSTTEGMSLLILGKQHELAIQEVSEVVDDFKNNSKVKWIDEIKYTELQDVIRGADLGFVHYEGENLNTRFSAPGKIYEYLKAGLMVLTDEGQEIGPVIQARNAGMILSRPISTQALQDAFRNCVENPSDVEMRKDNASLVFHDTFAFEIQVESLIQSVKQASGNVDDGQGKTKHFQ